MAERLSRAAQVGAAKAAFVQGDPQHFLHGTTAADIISLLPATGIGNIELNLGMHGAQGEESLQNLRDRFGALKGRLETQLQRGVPVVYVAEGALFTTEQSQRISHVLQQYPDVSPSDA